MVIRLEPHELADGELRLRPWRAEDVPAIAEACRDPEIARWTRVPDDYTEQDARDFVTASAEGWRRGDGAGFAITDAATGELLGAIGVRFVDEGVGPRAAIGYWMKREARGRGIAAHALGIVSRWAIEDLGQERVELMTDPDNIPSQRVAERAGFTREAVLRDYLELKGRRRDCVMFSLLPRDLEG